MWVFVDLVFLVWLLFALAGNYAGILLTLAATPTVVRVVKRRKAARRMAERQKTERLIRHADEEHQWVQKGMLEGVYGSDYLPPPAVYGMGIWIAGRNE